MLDHRNLGRSLRALWATLGVILLLGAGAAYGVTRYLQSELEADATKDARKLSADVLQPLLIPPDAGDPVRGARYDELRSGVEKRVLAGPISAVRLWAADGTILFADRRELVGDREPAMRDDIHAVIAGPSRSSVDGDRFRTLTVLEIGSPPTVVAAELVRSHAAMVEASRQTWYPWVLRGLTGAVACVGLYLLTAIVFLLVGLLAGRSAGRRAATEGSFRRLRRKAGPVPDEDLPAYMLPGFQERIEAKRRVEEEVKATPTEGDARERVQRLEAEPQGARDSSRV